MNHLLKLYYGIDKNVEGQQYFYDRQRLYYLTPLHDQKSFLDVFQYYRYFVYLYDGPFYSIVQNCHDDMISHQHVLLLYHEKTFNLENYLNTFLQPLSYQHIRISDIKEQWIHKIDQVKGLLKQYAYSFKHKPELVSLICYYTGMAENSINILNEILSIHQQASVFMGLSLKYIVNDYVHDLMNPMHYVISTRMRHLLYLLKSHIISYHHLQDILEHYYFDVYEILYFYARVFFPSSFFDEVLSQQMNQERIDFYFLNVEKEKEMLNKITQILSLYVSLPKISWINHENVI